MSSLVYVDYQRMPGTRGTPHGETFQYFDQSAQRVTNAYELRRIAKLAVPPAYVNLWICPLSTVHCPLSTGQWPMANGHIQATGRNARGRKHYRHHADWRAARGQDKFERVFNLGAALPNIRRHLADTLAASSHNTGAPRHGAGRCGAVIHRDARARG